jgi:hypothetical protein
MMQLKSKLEYIMEYQKENSAAKKKQTKFVKQLDGLIKLILSDLGDIEYESRKPNKSH